MTPDELTVIATWRTAVLEGKEHSLLRRSIVNGTGSIRALFNERLAIMHASSIGLVSNDELAMAVAELAGLSSVFMAVEHHEINSALGIERLDIAASGIKPEKLDFERLRRYAETVTARLGWQDGRLSPMSGIDMVDLRNACIAHALTLPVTAKLTSQAKRIVRKLEAARIAAAPDN